MTKFVIFVAIVCGACGGKAAPASGSTEATANGSAASGTETSGTEASGGASGTEAPKTACDAGEEAIASRSDCLQDDAVCYQLADGSWCTGGQGPGGNW